jgi:hypothetical protein
MCMFLLNMKKNIKMFFYSSVQLYFLFLGYGLKIPKLPTHRPFIFPKNVQCRTPIKVFVKVVVNVFVKIIFFFPLRASFTVVIVYPRPNNIIFHNRGKGIDLQGLDVVKN